jgi:hypothetical protein
MGPPLLPLLGSDSAGSHSLTHSITITVRVRVRVTLRLAVYRQSVRLGGKPLEDHDQSFAAAGGPHYIDSARTAYKTPRPLLLRHYVFAIL